MKRFREFKKRAWQDSNLRQQEPGALLEETNLGEFRKPNGKRISPHDLKHTFTTWLHVRLGNQFSAHEIQKLERHESEEASAIYRHATRFREMVEFLEAEEDKWP